MGVLIAAATLLVGFTAAYVASDDVRYLTRAGIEETAILMAREPMRVVAADSSRPKALREAAQLVLEVRNYADVLGFEAKQTYTTYSDVGRDTLLLVLTASPKNCLCPVTWSFPIVGRIPYKGFFDVPKAEAAARKYREMGYDVNLRPSGAFSTLGWFNDPLLSTAVSADSVELAALVFHEIAHNTLWVKDATDFNESFAQWVGYRSAERFFLARGDSGLALRALDRWHDEEILGSYFDLLLGKLDSLYSSTPDVATLQQGREAIARWSRDTLAAPFGLALRTVDPVRLGDRPINNAALLGVRLYRTGLDLFEGWYWDNDQQIDLAVYGLVELMTEVEGDQAWQRLRAVVRPEPLPALPD
jgi:predicted aminopeptidase